MNLPLIKLPFSPVNHSLSSSFKCKHGNVPGNCTSPVFSFSCWNHGGLQDRNANPPVSRFSTSSQGMKSAGYSGKNQTDLFPCQPATFKESKQCVVQEKEHPCESQGERQMGGSSTWVLSLEAGTAKPPLSRAVYFLAGPLEPEISQLT